MEFNRESLDEFNTLLLSAVHKGDVTALKTHLSSVLDPSLYLNRVYDESKQQKCTLLMIACLIGYENMVYMLLDCFKPNLEVLNVIRLRNKNMTSNLYRNVTVLWAATAINHFLIVKRLVEYGACVSHRNNKNITPLQCVCRNGNVFMARYLVANGANINIASHNNRTNLLTAIHRKKQTMIIYLVDELGCDINECDDNGRSPLYYAVNCESLDIIQFLLNRGARNFPATYDQMSPLMMAAEKRRSDLVNAISSYCSVLESIEAEELLGSAFACVEHGHCDLQKSFEHFCRALELRSIYNLPKALRSNIIDIFNNRQECQTIDHLRALQLNSDDIYTEALLVRERLLGPNNIKYRYTLSYRGTTLANNAQYHRAVALWLYELGLRQKYSIDIDPKCLRGFMHFLSKTVYESSSILIEAFLTITSITVEKVKHNIEKIDYNLYTMLFLTSIVSQTSVDAHLSATDRKTFYGFLHSIIHGRYVTSNDRSTLLHLCLSDSTPAFNSFGDHIYKYPCLQTVRTLLKCGADVNTLDAVGNTPLHIFVSNSGECNETILQLLCNAGAHLDCINTLGKTPVDITSNLDTKHLLKAKLKISLKCLCAQMIQKSNIPFHGMISTSLVTFVEKH